MRQKNTRDASKLPEYEGEKPKTQVNRAMAVSLFLSGPQDRLPLDKTPKESPTNYKTYGFVIAMIVGIGALGVGLMGLNIHQGWWVPGALSQVSQVNAIILMAGGGGGGFVCLIVAMVFKVTSHKTHVEDYSGPQYSGFSDQMSVQPLETSKAIQVGGHDVVIWGKDAWKKIGDVGEEPPLPADLEARLNAKCPYSDNTTDKVKDTFDLLLIPATVSTLPFSLDSVRTLITDIFIFTYDHAVKQAHGSASPAQSYWILKKRTSLEGERESYETQIDRLHEDQVPHALEEVAYFMVRHVIGAIKDVNLCYLRCDEKVGNEQVMIRSAKNCLEIRKGSTIPSLFNYMSAVHRFIHA